jgi:hypothetical protein
MMFQFQSPDESDRLWPWVEWLLDHTGRLFDHVLLGANAPITIFLAVALLVLWFYRKSREYTKAWTPIIAFLWLGILFIHQDFVLSYFQGDMLSEPDKQLMAFYFPTLVFIGISLLVIAYVCVVYTGDIHKIAKHDDRSERLKTWAQGMCWVCIGFAVALAVYVLEFAGKAHESRSWDLLAEINELTSLVTFIFFIAIDVLVWKAAKDATSQRSKDIGGLAFEALFIVDVPCVIGILFLMCVHHSLHRWMPQNALFTVGLSAGAIAFHVAITQAAFAVAKTRFLMRHKH